MEKTNCKIKKLFFNLWKLEISQKTIKWKDEILQRIQNKINDLFDKYEKLLINFEKKPEFIEKRVQELEDINKQLLEIEIKFWIFE